MKKMEKKKFLFRITFTRFYIMDYLCNHRPVSVAAEIAVLERCHPRQSSHHSTRHPPYQVRNASGKTDYESAMLALQGTTMKLDGGLIQHYDQ